MKKFLKTSIVAMAVVALIFTGCEEDNLTEQDSLEVSEYVLEGIIINNSNVENRTVVTDPDLLNSIRTLDIDVGVVSIGDFHLPDGTVEERIYIGNDITFTREELRLLIDPDADDQRQYRTFNLVTGANRTIDILGYTGGSQALSSKAQTALQWTV